MTQKTAGKTKSKKTQKQDTQLTHIYFLLDESGSMAATAADVRGGFNTYVKNLAGDGNTYRLSAVKFGTTVRPLFADMTLENVPELTEKNYMPQDTTALYDALGYIFELAQKHATTEKPYGTDRNLVIIMTDGYENASRSYTKDKIVEGIKVREAAGNWTFVYLGADQDAWAIGGGLGLSKGNVMSYASAQTQGTFSTLSGATSRSSSSSRGSTDTFFDDK